MAKKNQRELYWPSKNGNILIADMKDDHLLNTILYIETVKVEDSSANSWWATQLHISYEAMEKERIRRELPFPLLPFKSLDYRKEEINGK